MIDGVRSYRKLLVICGVKWDSDLQLNFFNLAISFSRRSRRDSVCALFCSALFKNWFRSLW